MSTPTHTDFKTTIVHGRNGIEYVRATIEGRLCNVHYSAAHYLAGQSPPRYPVPATIRYVEPVCFFCGSITDRCNRLPQDCLDNSLRVGLQLT